MLLEMLNFPENLCGVEQSGKQTTKKLVMIYNFAWRRRSLVNIYECHISSTA